MAEIELIHILIAIGSGFVTLFARFELTCKKIDKLVALNRLVHPNESKKLKL